MKAGNAAVYKNIRKVQLGPVTLDQDPAPEREAYKKYGEGILQGHAVIGQGRIALNWQSIGLD